MQKYGGIVERTFNSQDIVEILRFLIIPHQRVFEMPRECTLLSRTFRCRFT